MALNIEKYIESGILNLYVLGVASDEEMREVEALMRKYPEVRQEVRTAQEAIACYAKIYEAHPPEPLKDKIWEAIQEAEQKQEQDEAPPELKISREPTTTQKPDVQEIAKKAIMAKLKSTLLKAATYLLLAISIGINIYLYAKWSGAENQLTSLRAENAQFASAQDVQKANYQAAIAQLEVLKNPQNRIIRLSGIPDFQNLTGEVATVFWNPETTETFIQTNGLPEPPEGKQYQLWFVRDGKVIDGGIFETGELHKVKNADKAEQFIVTLEKRGGVPKAEGPACAKGDV
ncbi:MAG: anti-sigma factor [Bernardetiaceae bacterium]|nr:anti-sigma factor [Bernardetiaceae bacterium]